MSDAPPAELRAARHAGAALRRRPRRCRAAHGDGARHPARPAAAARAGEDAQPPGLHGVRLWPAVPRGDRQACRCDDPPAADAASAGAADRGSCSTRRSRTEATSLAQRAMITDRNGQILAISLADGRGVRRSAADHRSGRCGAPAEAGAAAARRGRPRGRACPIPTGSSSIWNARSRRASNWRSMRWAFPGSISARPRSGTIRWAAPRRRCWAASMSTSTASPASRSTSTSACSRDRAPLRLSIDVRVQAVVRDELSKAMEMFQAIGGCGIVMDVNTGEVLAMVSLPDYDANDFRTAPADDRFNRAVDRHVRAGQHVQAADRVDGAGFRHRAHLGRVRRRRTRSISAASPSPTSRASIAGCICRRCWPTRPISVRRISRETVGGERQRAWLQVDGHVRPRRHRAAGGRHADHPAGVGLEGDRDHDRGVRPRHLGLAVARGARHRRGRDRRAGAPDHPARCRRASSRKACR